jgi:hypothetical protein
MCARHRGMNDTAIPELHLCRTCRRPLDYHQHHDGRPNTHEHPVYAEPYDHPVDPIPASMVDGEMVGVCDFCTNPGPRWRYRCDDFVIPTGGPQDYGSTGDWMACDECAADITAGNWDIITARALDQHPEAARSYLAQMLRRILEGFLAHRKDEAPTDTYKRRSR